MRAAGISPATPVVYPTLISAPSCTAGFNSGSHRRIPALFMHMQHQAYKKRYIMVALRVSVGPHSSLNWWRSPIAPPARIE